MVRSPYWWAEIKKFLNVGAVFDSLRCADVPRFSLPIPPLSHQDAISSLLGALDDKIALNRQMNKTLEAMARAIFKDWFVDFGPVRAKAEGCPPYLSSDLWSLFPDKLDEDDKPVGWEWQPISTFASLVRNTVVPSAFPDEIFDHYSIPAYDVGYGPKSDTGSSILSNKTVVPNDGVLLSKLNPDIPRVWMTDRGRTARGVCSTEFLALVSQQYVGREFLYSVFVEDGFRQRLQAMVTGTSKSHQRVGPQSVLNLEIVFPSPPIIEAFRETARPLFDRLLGNRREIRTLASLRDLLLPKLMSGEIRLKDAEQALDAVA
jgi:type I restriction enzyme S subunit